MCDDIDPQPRNVAAADTAIEQLNVAGNILEQRIERLIEQLEARNVGIAQIDNDAGALGSLDAGLAHSIPQRILGFRRFRIRFFASPHAANLSTAKPGEKPKSISFQEV
jgi:hypothetical protein